MGIKKDHTIVSPIIKTETVTTSDDDNYTIDFDRKIPTTPRRLSAYTDEESYGPSLSPSNGHSKLKRLSEATTNDDGKHEGSKKLYPFYFQILNMFISYSNMMKA